MSGKSVTYQTTYLGNYEKVYRTGGAGTLTEHKFYVGDIIFTQRSNGSNDTFYLHKDHQGSVIATTNASGTVVSQAIYDPWGKRTAVYLTSVLANFTYSEPTDRGYTGHKHIKDLDIIHMGGRIYDPTLGRFLQADPHIQAPMNSQNYNRYSYVLNNPLSYTDPSGYFFKALFKAIGKVKWLSTIISVALNFIPGCQVWCSAAFNAAVTYAVTGSLKGALIGAFVGAISPGGFSPGAFLARGIIGGLASRVQGGNFGHGFIAAGASGAAGGIGNVPLRILASAVIGGTVSNITGGKFANGATSAAFATIVEAGFKGDFRSEADVSQTNSQQTVKGDVKAFEKELRDLEINGTLSSKRKFKTADDAAKEVLSVTAPLSDKYGLEVGGNITQDGKFFSYTSPVVGEQGAVGVGFYGVAGYHTHPSGSLMFSNKLNNFSNNINGGDSVWVSQSKLPLYLGVGTAGNVRIGVCEYRSCSHIGQFGTNPSRVIQP